MRSFMHGWMRSCMDEWMNEWIYSVKSVVKRNHTCMVAWMGMYSDDTDTAVRLKLLFRSGTYSTKEPVRTLQGLHLEPFQFPALDNAADGALTLQQLLLLMMMIVSTEQLRHC